MIAVPKFIFNISLVLVFSLFLFSFQLSAKDNPDEIASDRSEDFADEVLEWKFKEDVVDIPDYPKEATLIRLDVDTGGSPFEYFIDKKSLSIGIDGIVLYTIVMRSNSGGRNVLFEAMHCSEAEYKTHAYGTSKKEFYVLQNARWKPIVDKVGAGTDYRYDLFKTFFCDEYRTTLEKSEMLQRIEYPEDFSSNSGVDG